MYEKVERESRMSASSEPRSISCAAGLFPFSAVAPPMGQCRSSSVLFEAQLLASFCAPRLHVPMHLFSSLRKLVPRFSPSEPRAHAFPFARHVHSLLSCNSSSLPEKDDPDRQRLAPLRADMWRCLSPRAGHTKDLTRFLRDQVCTYIYLTSVSAPSRKSRAQLSIHTSPTPKPNPSPVPSIDILPITAFSNPPPPPFNPNPKASPNPSGPLSTEPQRLTYRSLPSHTHTHIPHPTVQ